MSDEAAGAVQRPGAPYGGERRIGAPWRWLPCAVSVAIATLEFTTLGRMFFPDTAAFVVHGWHAGQDIAFPTFNPGYPLLIDVLCLLLPAAARLTALVLLQQACVVLIPWFVLRCGERLGRPGVGLLAALLVALHAPLSLFAQSAQSDSLFAFLLAWCTFEWIRTLADPAGRGGWRAGALAALAMALRSSGIALVAAAVVAVLFSHPWRLRRPLAGFLAGFALLLALVLAKNRFDCGRATLVDGDGIHLFCRVAGVDRVLPATPEAARLERLAAFDGLPSPFVPQAGWKLHRLLQEREKLSATAADDLLRDVALDALAIDPWRSARLTLESMVRTVGPGDVLAYTVGSSVDAASDMRHRERTVATWSRSPERMARALELLPPVAPRAESGSRAAALLAAFACASRGHGGAWVLVALLFAGLLGLLLRDPALLFFSGLPVAQVAASALGEVPFPGHFDPVVPATWLTLLLSAAELFDHQMRTRFDSSRHIASPASTPNAS
jgi:hypothetical protein